MSRYPVSDLAASEDWADDGRRAADEADGQQAGGSTAHVLPEHVGHWLGPLASEFEALARSLFEATTVSGVLARVVDVTHKVVPGADLVSVTLATTNGDHMTPAHTEQLAADLDRLQYDLGEGPSLEATHNPGAGQATSYDLGEGREWPSFGPAAADMGVRSVLATGMFPDGQPPRLGALNCYSHEAHGLDAADHNIALLLAAHASTALAATQAVSAAELETVHLMKALESRDVIGQAKGILMQRRNIDADQAFDILRKASQSLNIKLAEISRTLTTQRDKL
jgi:GAF domain-containing protein